MLEDLYENNSYEDLKRTEVHGEKTLERRKCQKRAIERRKCRQLRRLYNTVHLTSAASSMACVILQCQYSKPYILSNAL